MKQVLKVNTQNLSLQPAGPPSTSLQLWENSFQTSHNSSFSLLVLQHASCPDTEEFSSNSPCPRSVVWLASPRCWSSARRTPRRWWGRARAETACLWTAAGDMTCPRLKDINLWSFRLTLSRYHVNTKIMHLDKCNVSSYDGTAVRTDTSSVPACRSRYVLRGRHGSLRITLVGNSMK